VSPKSHEQRDQEEAQFTGIVLAEPEEGPKVGEEGVAAGAGAAVDAVPVESKGDATPTMATHGIAL